MPVKLQCIAFVILAILATVFATGGQSSVNPSVVAVFDEKMGLKILFLIFHKRIVLGCIILSIRISLTRSL